MNDHSPSDLQHPSQLRASFLEAMSCAAFSVNIATTDGIAGRAGLTVSAMTSVSADPPSILLCVNKNSQFSQRIRNNACFGVSVLPQKAEELADIFAGRENVEDKFAFGDWTTYVSQSPISRHAVAAFDCSLLNVHTVGSHDIVVGTVLHSTSIDRPFQPLVHHRRRYVNIAPGEVS